MIIYKNTIDGFIRDCDQDIISARLRQSLKEKGELILMFLKRKENSETHLRKQQIIWVK